MDGKTSITDVMIDGVKYYPENTSSTADKPFGEPEVNYRALVNDKLCDLETFYELRDEDKRGEDSLNFNSHNNSESFIRAGRVQEVVRKVAFYGGNSQTILSLYLYTDTDATWKQVYQLLLDYEPFIKTGKKFRS